MIQRSPRFSTLSIRASRFLRAAMCAALLAPIGAALAEDAVGGDALEANRGLASPSLIAPRDGSIHRAGQRVYVAWRTVAGAASYAYEIAATPDFTAPIVSSSTKRAIAQSPVLDAAQAGSTLYWRVRACPNDDGTSCGSWSTTRAFIVGGVDGPDIKVVPDSFNLRADSLLHLRAFTVRNDGPGSLTVSQFVFENLATWAFVTTPTPFTLTQGQTREVEVMLDATGFGQGTAQDRLLVVSNDPDESILPGGVAVALSASGRPAETSTQGAFSIVNEGTAPLAVQSIDVGDASDWLEATPSVALPTTLQPGARLDVALAVDASTLPQDAYSANVTIASDDADEASVVVPVALAVGSPRALPSFPLHPADSAPYGDRDGAISAEESHAYYIAWLNARHQDLNGVLSANDIALNGPDYVWTGVAWIPAAR